MLAVVLFIALLWPCAAPASEPEEVVRVQGVEVRGGYNRTIHTHGGPPASVASAELVLAIGEGEHEVRVRSLALLDRHCRETAWSGTQALTVQALRWTGEGEREPGADAAADAALPVTAPGGRLQIVFAPVEVYQVCDGFAFAVTLTIDGEPASLVVPLTVMREEPYHEDVP